MFNSLFISADELQGWDFFLPPAQHRLDPFNVGEWHVTNDDEFGHLFDVDFDQELAAINPEFSFALVQPNDDGGSISPPSPSSEYASSSASPISAHLDIAETYEMTTVSYPATPFPSSAFAFEGPGPKFPPRETLAAVENDADVHIHTVSPPTRPATMGEAPAEKMPANRKGKAKARPSPPPEDAENEEPLRKHQHRVQTEAPPPPECTQSTAKYYRLGQKYYCKVCREAGYIFSQQYERDIIRHLEAKMHTIPEHVCTVEFECPCPDNRAYTRRDSDKCHVITGELRFKLCTDLASLATSPDLQLLDTTRPWLLNLYKMLKTAVWKPLGQVLVREGLVLPAVVEAIDRLPQVP
ncbi:hypothetical protein NLJ89_g7645 [Agrocybe chaxingu]|uniref:Uncharacterized protein n=1 Tax=Agrocybe chaxingu TaxID=84603 RepID=A0A9W8MSX0_9AGAR|nr:hypothetical protein NLJ89_g7645 [Agrocybe chaxingu]